MSWRMSLTPASEHSTLPRPGLSLEPVRALNMDRTAVAALVAARFAIIIRVILFVHHDSSTC